MVNKIWTIQTTDNQLAEKLKTELELPPLVADIMVQRGLKTAEAAVDFLRPSLLNLSSPFAFTDMPKAVERLRTARAKGEKVLIYGDYDVDGVTSTALLYKTLIDLGFKAVAYIPHRQEEGYGLNVEAIEKAADAEVKVLITVDCGISAVTEIKAANDLGIDVIVTDHHEPQALLPQALALINPKLPESGYPFPHLAGVGVAFKLVQGLLQELGGGEYGVARQQELLDLVALGTIADIVPLVGENRILVAKGLAQMENTLHVGLAALLAECGLWGKKLKAGQIGFILAPRINAAGRMDSARTGLELLLTEDRERGEELARTLSKENSLRQQTEQQILAGAIEILEQGPIPRVIVLSGKDWHHGVIGIVASRLVERYYRPVFLLTEDGEESKGSARGIKGYHVLEQLTDQQELLEKFGGHKQAAGFSLKTANISLLRDNLNDAVADWPEEVFQERLLIDQKVDFQHISPPLLHYLEQLAPFGFGNSSPLLAGMGYDVHSISAVGRDSGHLRISFGRQGEKKGIAFRQGEKAAVLQHAAKLDVAFSLEWNSFQGNEEIQLVLKDVQAQAVCRDAEDGTESGEEVAGSEVSAGREGIPAYEIEWLDWRNRKDFLDKGWSRDAVGNFFYYSNNADTGVMTEWPLSAEDFKTGIRTLLSLGIRKIALGGEKDDEGLLRKRCRFFSRDELAGAYRYLQTLVKQDSLIWAKPSAGQSGPCAFSADEWLDILKIFEDLGLIHYLGGSESMAFRWIRAERKLDLEQSLRYRTAEKRFIQAREFQELLKEKPLKSFKELIQWVM